jgi:hypothetical protein
MAQFLKTCLLTAAVAGGVLTASAQTDSNTELAAAGDVCGQRSDLVERLLSEFRENQAAVGTLHESAILEVFVSDQGTWTILATGTDGRSCVLAAGQDFEIALTAIGQGV